jgi:hypothetical protein
MATIYVKKDGSGDALTVQQGIQLASLGDIVEVEAGTFNENIDLWKGVTLKGAGIGSTIITGAVRTAITARTFTWTLGSTTLNVAAGADISAYEVGRIVTATGIPTNTRIVSKTSTTLTISAATTQAATTARSVAMALQNDASVRVRGTSGVIRDLKVVGFDHPNPATEYSTIYFRNTGLGSVAAFGWEVFNCEFEANGEYAFLTDFAAGVGNLNVHDCKFTGKTFVGNNPSTGNQFSVWNVPRQLVTIQSVNSGEIKFQNNEVSGSTGGLTVDGVQSYNTACTIDPISAVISGNTLTGDFGYGYAIRARGLNASVENNTASGVSSGYYILPNHSVGVLVLVGTMIANSSKYWICSQEHTSSSTNAPTGVDGSQYWSEVTVEQVNASGDYGIGLLSIGTNNASNEVLVTFNQASSGQPIEISFSKSLLKQISSVSGDLVFSDEQNWHLVGVVYKKESKRMTSAFKDDFEGANQMKLKSGLSGEVFQLHKFIISKADRTLKVVKRSEITNASSFDITLK